MKYPIIQYWLWEYFLPSKEEMVRREAEGKKRFEAAIASRELL